MKTASAELPRFEPTVFGAVRRYRVMVAVVVIAAVAAALGYTALGGRSYRAQSSVSVPLPPSQQTQNAAQYLDSQVLLMQSQGVAQQAARIADGTLGRKVLTPGSFLGPGQLADDHPAVRGRPRHVRGQRRPGVVRIVQRQDRPGRRRRVHRGVRPGPVGRHHGAGECGHRGHQPGHQRRREPEPADGPGQSADAGDHQREVRFGQSADRCVGHQARRPGQRQPGPERRHRAGSWARGPRRAGLRTGQPPAWFP